MATVDGAKVYRIAKFDDREAFEVVVDGGDSTVLFKMSNADYVAFQNGVTGRFDYECRKAIQRIGIRSQKP